MNEKAVVFGPASQLVGTLNPAALSENRSKTGLLLLNAGTIHRIGPHRINVKLARKVAQQGVPSLRFDLSGLGDSGQASDESRQVRAQHDISAAVDFLRESTGVERVVLFGICSGADDGYHAAALGSDLAGLILFDPYVFPTLRWRTRLMMGKIASRGVKGSLERLREKTEMSPEQGGGLFSALTGYGRDIPPIGEYARVLGRLAGQGTKIHLVYSASTVDAEDYREQIDRLCGSHGLQGKISTEFLPDVDHVITTRKAQGTLLNRIMQWVSQDQSPDDQLARTTRMRHSAVGGQPLVGGVTD